MPPTLNAVERRVLGVLLEKALAQPQYYPMTVNAIVAACNQKSNREPILELDEDTVWNTLEVLRAGGLVSRLLPGGASRVERYKHEARERLGWEKPQRAVMAELLLRGPQTLGELRGHAARMYPFETTEAVSLVVDGLGQCEPPVVATLPRQPGQAAVRYAHRLYPTDEWEALQQSAAPGSAIATPTADDYAAPAAGLRAEVDELRSEVELLREAVGKLTRRLDAWGA
jgi:uncharacterized protein YceH (UPF0502 family)